MIKKCRCKGTMRQCQSMASSDWEDIFIKDKWYEVNHVEWSSDPNRNMEMYRINGGWRDYLAKTESGIWKQLSRAEFRVVFYSDSELRNTLIDEIIL